MTAIKPKEQLVKELTAVRDAVKAVYNGLDKLNGALYPVTMETDLGSSLAVAGIVGDDVEIAFSWVNEWYMHQLPSSTDLDTLIDVLETYIDKLSK